MIIIIIIVYCASYELNMVYANKGCEYRFRYVYNLSKIDLIVYTLYIMICYIFH